MNRISLSTRCTREEYMTFCVQHYKKLPWVTVNGVILLILAAVGCVMTQTVSQGTVLQLLLALVLLLLNPVILPFFRKADAAKRYDASDTLKQAVGLVMDDSTLTVQSATVEGTLPLSSMTSVEETSSMIALIFGKEFSVYIPKRALRDDELKTLQSIVAMY